MNKPGQENGNNNDDRRKSLEPNPRKGMSATMDQN